MLHSQQFSESGRIPRRTCIPPGSTKALAQLGWVDGLGELTWWKKAIIIIIIIIIMLTIITITTTDIHMILTIMFIIIIITVSLLPLDGLGELTWRKKELSGSRFRTGNDLPCEFTKAILAKH